MGLQNGEGAFRCGDSEGAQGIVELAGATVSFKSKQAEKQYPVATKPVAVDLLTEAIDHVRPFLHRRRPLRERLADFWAAAAASIDLAASDVVEADFLALANDSGLATDLGHHRDADLRHVIEWARLGRDPFGAKP